MAQQWWAVGRMNGVTHLTSAETDDWTMGGGGLCQSIICAAECDDRKDKGKTEWVQRKWDGQVERVRKMARRVQKQTELRWSCQTSGTKRRRGVFRFSIQGGSGKEWFPRLLTSPCEWPRSFVVSLPRFHWAQQWSFLIPEQQEYEVNSTTVFAIP